MQNYLSSCDITLEVDGKTAAVVQEYHAKTTRDTRYVEAFGSLEPVGTIGGKTQHQLILKRVQLEGSLLDDGISFYDLSSFNIVIAKPTCRIIYSGCEWASLEENASLGNTILETVQVVATKRIVIRG